MTSKQRGRVLEQHNPPTQKHVEAHRGVLFLNGAPCWGCKDAHTERFKLNSLFSLQTQRRNPPFSFSGAFSYQNKSYQGHRSQDNTHVISPRACPSTTTHNQLGTMNTSTTSQTTHSPPPCRATAKDTKNG